jgi:hypothetical protein
MDPTVELVLRQPAAGPDPLAALLVVMLMVWIFATPWLRLCWWLGVRARGAS